MGFNFIYILKRTTTVQNGKNCITITMQINIIPYLVQTLTFPLILIRTGRSDVMIDFLFKKCSDKTIFFINYDNSLTCFYYLCFNF